MNEDHPLQLWMRHVTPAYPRVRGHRMYAFDDASWRGLAAYACGWQQRRAKENQRFDADKLDELIARLASKLDVARQLQPGDAPPTSKMWVDEVSGRELPDPFDKAHPDLEGQRILFERDRPLAEHLKAMSEKSPYVVLAALQDAAAQRAEIEAIVYGPAEHELNPLRLDNESAKAAFLRDNSPAVVRFWKREAELSPVRFPWSPASRNLTAIGQLTKADKELGELAVAAGEVEKGWINEQLAEATRQADEAEKQRQEAQKMLGRAA